MLIALTGNIASGKSTVAGLLAKRGATIIDADVLARQAVEPGTPALAAIVERWGRGMLTEDGTLDRAALRRLVFGDRQELDALNAIVHPHVEALRITAVAEARERGAQIIICDIPLLYERDLQQHFDAVILVDAPVETRLDRLTNLRHLTLAEAEEMIAAQMPAALKRPRADYVIDNDATLEALVSRVDDLWRLLAERAKSVP